MADKADKLTTLYPQPGFVLGFGLTPTVLHVSPEEADRLIAEYPSGYTKTPPKNEKPAPVADEKEA